MGRIAYPVKWKQPMIATVFFKERMVREPMVLLIFLQQKWIPGSWKRRLNLSMQIPLFCSRNPYPVYILFSNMSTQKIICVST